MAKRYNSFEITCSYMGVELEVTIDGSTCTKEDVLSALQGFDAEAYEREDMIGIEWEEDFKVTDWQDVPEWAQDFDVLAELMPEYEGSYHDIELRYLRPRMSAGYNLAM